MENVKCKKVNMFECEIPLYYSKHKYSIGRYERERERERFIICDSNYEIWVYSERWWWPVVFVWYIIVILMARVKDIKKFYWLYIFWKILLKE